MILLALRAQNRSDSCLQVPASSDLGFSCEMQIINHPCPALLPSWVIRRHRWDHERHGGLGHAGMGIYHVESITEEGT